MNCNLNSFTTIRTWALDQRNCGKGYSLAASDPHTETNGSQFKFNCQLYEGVSYLSLSLSIYFQYLYIYQHLPVNATVRIPHPRIRDSQGPFLAPSAYKQTSNYDRVLKPPETNSSQFKFNCQLRKGKIHRE